MNIMTNLEQELLIGAFALIASGIAWLIKIQSSTNRSLAEAVNQFKTAIAIIDIENKNQRDNCIMHKGDIKERREYIDGEIHNIKEDTTELITDVTIIKKDIIDIKKDVEIIKQDVVNIKQDVIEIKLSHIPQGKTLKINKLKT